MNSQCTNPYTKQPGSTLRIGKVEPPRITMVNRTMMRVVVTSVFRVVSSQSPNIRTRANATAPRSPALDSRTQSGTNRICACMHVFTVHSWTGTHTHTYYKVHVLPLNHMINWFSKVILTDLNLFTRAERGKMLTALPARHST